MIYVYHQVLSGYWALKGMYLVIYGLFNELSIARVDSSEWWNYYIINWKGYNGKIVSADIWLDTYHHESQFFGQELKQTPSEYKAAMPLAWLQNSVAMEHGARMEVQGMHSNVGGEIWKNVCARCRRCKDNMTVDLTETSCDSYRQMELVQY